MPRGRRWPKALLAAALAIVAACGVAALLWRAGVFGGTGLPPDGTGSTPAIVVDGDSFQLGDGAVEQKVTDVDSARDAAAIAGERLGIDNLAEHLSDPQVQGVFDNTFYRFYQQYEGIQVYGRSVVVGADSEGSVLSVTGNYRAVDGLDVTPRMSREDAVRGALEETDGAAVASSSLNIYVQDDGSSALVWLFEINGSTYERVIVDANTGEVVRRIPLIDAATISTQNNEGVTVELSVNEMDNGSIQLVDPERNIWGYSGEGNVVDAREATGSDERNNLYRLAYETNSAGNDELRFVNDAGDSLQSALGDNGYYTLTNDDGGTVTEEAYVTSLSFESQGSLLTPLEGDEAFFRAPEQRDAVTLQGYIADTVDVYRDVFGRDGIDGHGGPIYAVVQAPPVFEWGADPYNAGSFYVQRCEMVQYGPKLDIELDVVAHELTHGVESSISNLGAFGEPGALKESTSDIMAMVVEDYANDGVFNNDCNWAMGKMRNLADPLEGFGGQNAAPAEYGGEKWGNPNNHQNDRGSIHNNSVVVSHAAYLMVNGTDLAGSALSMEQLGQVVYLTFFPLVTETNFAQYRTTMENVAAFMVRQGRLSEQQLQRISAAFDEVKISRVDASQVSDDEEELGLEEQKLPDEGHTVATGSRDVALVLDVSGSMGGDPIAKMKEAASEFVNVAIDGDANVGVVAYDDEAQVLQGLSDSSSRLVSAITGLEIGGSTNMEDGLIKGEQALGTSDAERRIIVLMSDGAPNKGKTGDELVQYADALKAKGHRIYTVGFNEGPDGYALLSAMASDGCHYEVESSDDLAGFFADIAAEISGTRFMYVRIACPVDVTVNYGGNSLSSVADAQSIRADFGSLSFEDEVDPDGNVVEENGVKVLRLKEGPTYNVEISGVGEGDMDYTIGFVDAAGDYSDFRLFEGIEITPATHIDTVAEVSDRTRLVVDEDGDGVIDEAYEAGAHETARQVDSRWVVYATLGCCVVVTAGLAVVKRQVGIYREARRRMRAA